MMIATPDFVIRVLFVEVLLLQKPHFMGARLPSA
jgi:hypothetical protein